MIRDLIYPEDARKELNSLLGGLAYDAAVAVAGVVSECIALLPEDSTATIDADFAKDVEAAVESHREPLEPPAIH